MVKVSESRSTARRAILRKCAAVMPFLSQPTPQDSMPEAFPRLGNGRPVTDYDFHAYSAVRGDTTGMSPRDRLEGLARDLTDDANTSLWRDVVLSTNPISGVPYNLLKARGNYLRAGAAAGDGDLSRAADRHLESVGDAAMAGLSIVPGTSLMRFGPKAVAAARTALTGKQLLQGAGAVSLVDGATRVAASANPRAGTMSHAVSTLSDAAHDMRSIRNNADLARVRADWAARMSGSGLAPGSLAPGGPTAVDGIGNPSLRRAVEAAEFWPGVGSGVTFANDYHAHVSNGRNPGVSAARALASSLPGWRSYAQHPTAAHPYEFTLGPAGVPAGGSTVGQYAPAAAERQ